MKPFVSVSDITKQKLLRLLSMVAAQVCASRGLAAAGRDPGLTYHGDRAKRHDQRQRSEGVGGKHAQLAQQHQEQAQPPCFGLEIGSGVLGACQADVAVLLEIQERRRFAQRFWGKEAMTSVS